MALPDWRRVDCWVIWPGAYKEQNRPAALSLGTAVRGSFSRLAGRLRAWHVILIFALSPWRWQTSKKAEPWPFTRLVIYNYFGVDIGMVGNCRLG